MEINNFLDPDHYIKIYHQPFNFNGYTITTDGYSMILIPENKKYKEIIMAENIRKTINDILNDIEINTEFKPLPKIEIPEPVICPICNNTKKSIIKDCPECQGVGCVDTETDYNTYYDLECKTCNGDGDIVLKGEGEKCDNCNSIGKIEQEDYPIKIEDINVKYKFIKRIMNIDNIEVSVIKKKNMLLFKAKDIKGSIMGLNI